MRVELRAESQFISCLSTVVAFMFTLSPTTTTSLTPGLAERLGAGDAAVCDSKKPQLGRETAKITGSGGDGHVGCLVIRRVKVYFEDWQLAEKLRPSAPFKPPPRVSGKHATVKIEGLRLDKYVV